MASNSSRTTTGKKRKQMITGATSGSQETGSSKRKSQLETLKSQYRGTGQITPMDQNAGLSYKPAPPKVISAGSTGREAATIPGGSVSMSSTGAGGGVSGAVGDIGVSGANDITAPLTGKVGGYGIRPDAIPMLYQEPQALLRMTMQNMGLDPETNQGMYNMALPNADLVNALSMIALGGQGAGRTGYEPGENSRVLNYMDDLFRQGMTRGGQGIDFSAGMDNIFGAAKDSPMDLMMGGDDPRGQFAATSSLMMPLAEAGLHPLFARALQKQMESLRDEYYQTYATGAKPSGTFAGFAGGKLGM